MFEKTVKKTM